MSSQPADRVHPILDFTRRLSARLEELVAVPVWSMRDVEQRDTLVMLAKAGNQLDALRLRVLAEADRSGATDAVGAGTAADWVAVATRQVRREARAELRLAQGFEDHPVLAAGCEAGEVNLPRTSSLLRHLGAGLGGQSPKKLRGFGGKFPSPPALTSRRRRPRPPSL